MFSSKKKANTAVSSADGVTFAGYMEKRGRGRSMFGSRDYQTRYLMLNISTGYAQYFTDEFSLEKPLGDFNLRGAEISSSDTKDLVFSALVTSISPPESLEFRGLSEENRRAWLGAFRGASSGEPVLVHSEETPELDTVSPAVMSTIDEDDTESVDQNKSEDISSPVERSIQTKVPFAAITSPSKTDASSIDVSRSSSSSEVDQTIDYLSPAIAGGEIFKQGRGRYSVSINMCSSYLLFHFIRVNYLYMHQDPIDHKTMEEEICDRRYDDRRYRLFSWIKGCCQVTLSIICIH